MLLLMFATGAIAQPYLHFSRNQKHISIAYKFYRNLIVIPVKLNGKGPYNFVLDTGVGVLTITDPAIKDALRLQTGKKLLISGLGEKEGVNAFTVSGVSVSMPGLESLPMTGVVFEEDPFFLSTYLGVKITGIIGYEFFSSFVVKINYGERILTLYDYNHFKPSEKYESLPIEIRSNKPFIKASCSLNNEDIPLDLLLDTGAGFPLSLQSNSDKRIKIPERHLETQLGLGLNGIINGSLARTNEVRIGTFNFFQVITSFPDYNNWESKAESGKRNGSIGNFILKRFSVILDYNNRKLYLKPNSKFKEPFEYDRVGIEVVGGGEAYNRFIIFQVKPNSPAAEAGIQPDDELVEVNFVPVKNMELGNIDHLFSDPGAKSIMLKIIRGEEFRYILLRMHDLI
ncbi:MAG: aspartyl protease family protein [Chitinophagaceae bacterium]|nr:aspartyl protease family protein [Chitinophagaceae bacterium]